MTEEVRILLNLIGFKDGVATMREVRDYRDQINARGIELKANTSDLKNTLSILRSLDDEESKARAKAISGQIELNKMAMEGLNIRKAAASQLLGQWTFEQGLWMKREQAIKANAKLEKDTQTDTQKYLKWQEENVKAFRERVAREEEEERRKRLDDFKFNQWAWDMEARRGEEVRRIMQEGRAEDQRRIREGLETTASVFESIGSALTLSGGLGQSLADSFGEMANLFQVNFIDKVGDALANMFAESLTGNMKNILNRADILNTFSSYMDLMGVTKYDASQALERVDLSIRGLPIGLDEAAQRLRRYTMLSNDLERATNITIGIQKAITAGGASQQMRNAAYLQMDRLMSVGELTTSRQWMALINGLGTSARFLAEAMGLEGFTGRDLVGGLYSKDITADELLDALAALGEGTVDAAKDLDRALNIYKSTYESWQTNIKFAFTRGGANVVNTLSDTLGLSTGRGITGYMEVFRNGVNNVFSGVQNWVSGNGEGFARIVNSVRDLIEAFKGIGGGEIGSKILENFAKAIDLIANAINHMSTGPMGEFVAFATTMAGPLYKILQLFGRGLPALMGVFDRINGMDFNRVIDDLASSMNVFAKVISGLLSVIPDGMLSGLMSFALVWGKPLGAVFNTISGGIRSIVAGLQASTSGWAFREGGLLGWIAKLVQDHGGLSAIGGALSSVATGIGAIGVAVASYARQQRMLQDLQAETDKLFGVEGYKALENRSADARRSLDEAIENGDKTAETAETNARAAKDLIAQIEVLNDGKHLTELKVLVEQLNAIFPDWGAEVDDVTGKVTENTKAILDNADAYLEAVRIQGEADLVSTYMRAKLEAETERSVAYRKYIAAKGEFDIAEKDYLGLQSGYAEYRRKNPLSNVSWYDFLELPGNAEIVARYNSAQSVKDSTFATWKNWHSVYSDSFEKLTIASKKYQQDLATQSDITTQAITDGAAVQGDAIDELAKKYEELAQSAHDAYSELRSGFEMPDEREEIDLADDLAAIEAHHQLDYEYGEDVKAIQKWIKEHPSDWRTAYFLNQVLSEGNDGRIHAYAEALRGNGKYDEDYVVKVATVGLNRDAFAKTDRAAFEMERWGKQYGEFLAAADEGVDGILAYLENPGRTPEEIKGAIQMIYWLNHEQGGSVYGYLAELVAQGIMSEDEVILIAAEVIGQKGGEEMAKFFQYGFQQYFRNGHELITTDTRSPSGLPMNQPGFDAGPIHLLASSPSDLPWNKVAPTDLVAEEVNAIEAIKQSIADAANMEDIKDELSLSNHDVGVDAFKAFYEGAKQGQEQMVRQLAQNNPLLAAQVSQAMSIVATPTVTINPIVVKGHVNRGGDVQSYNSQNGGEVPDYLALGGIFSPKGSDTVPAMLTPGEFVQKRAAVEMFGKKFMERVNALDIRGSIDAMSRQFGLPFMGGPFVNTNNVRDNHATVNQTNITNNQNFTYKKAFRFASGLA